MKSEIIDVKQWQKIPIELPLFMMGSFIFIKKNLKKAVY